MLYLNTRHIQQLGICWEDLIGVIREAVLVLQRKEYSQPVKPYLRYGDPGNRIIAMPAFVGGDAPMAGIKWIASFPGNIEKNTQRANSITILNEYDTGVVLCSINTNLVSAIRTASVSGVVAQHYLHSNPGQPLNIGIVGFGPIGRIHLQMLAQLLGQRLKQVKVFDLRPIDRELIPVALRDKVSVCKSWQECFTEADIFVTCTVSADRYINLPPKKGSLQLNVSLRDYVPDTRQYMDTIIVDSWDEVCRENTDIEKMHTTKGLSMDDTITIAQFLDRDISETPGADDVIMFNPMGMAVFDVAVGGFYYRQAMKKGVGIELPA
jgi:2,3-diaminopropionate biosynthesis protein SbnB